jgi:signal peptidase I
MPELSESVTKTQKKTKDEKQPKLPRDPAREAVETVVFVVVLVLLLKLFVTEAFVIPTGSMAETLYGYQTMVKCSKCGHEFPVNAHDEAEGNKDGRKMQLYGYCCPNCRYQGLIKDLDPLPSYSSGDRVLVLKPLYNVQQPKRGDVVVFKFPEKPQEKHTAQNYIKRAEGFGGETLAVYRGDLYVTTSLVYPENDPIFPRPTSDLKLWEKRYMYSTVHDSNPRALELFEQSRAAGFPPGPRGFGTGGFEIVRKGEQQLLADRRIVWNNDKQPKELAGLVPPRWYAFAEGSDTWRGDDKDQPKVFGHSGTDLNWIRYRHFSKQWKDSRPDPFDDHTAVIDLKELGNQSPAPIDNFLGYNAGRDLDPANSIVGGRSNSMFDERWVGDLILECEADLNSSSEVVLELSKGVNRFQAKFANGNVTLEQTGRGSENLKKPSRPCKVKDGHYKIRFANVDCRLWVWVDGKCIDFGSDGDYQPVDPGPSDGADPEGWVKINDVDAPASIGAKGQVTISHIVLHRDIYYTRSGSGRDPADIFYVQPGHYLCLGDNSAQSSDSRTWGTVPERLMLGKAVFVFFPVFPTMRLGFIK